MAVTNYVFHGKMTMIMINMAMAVLKMVIVMGVMMMTVMLVLTKGLIIPSIAR